MTIGIIQPDSGNIRSVCDALERLNRPFRLLRQPDLQGIHQLILPGQGRFGAVMRYLEKNDWGQTLEAWVNDERPLLGICVGMQVLFDSSEEDPDTPGLGLLPGEIVKLPASKLPMIGWAPIRWKQPGFPEGAAYFVNSYALLQSPTCLATVNHGATFCAAIRKGSITAFQFHPEKSGRWGKELLNLCLIS